jgi:UDP:flavonoid glycosyltransferase YjiC (YdhE family)
VRLAVRRVLGDETIAGRAPDFAAWARRHDGAAVAAGAVEELARRRANARP